MKRFLLLFSIAMVASASVRSEVVIIGRDGEKKKAFALPKSFYDEKTKTEIAK
jgi:hypothetical protein